MSATRGRLGSKVRSSSPGSTIRLVVLNFNGGDHVLRCVQHLHDLEWPKEDLEIVVVDNASTDGSREALADAFPFIRLLRLPTNDGFPANNLALRDLRGIRYVGLINNDAFVEPGYLAPLVAELDRNEDLGAVSPLLVFEPRFVTVELRTTAARPGRGDPRELGVMISGLRMAGEDVWRAAQVAEGGHGPEVGARGSYEWTGERAKLRVPVSRRDDAMSSVVEIRLSAVTPRLATLASGLEVTEVEVSTRPTWFAVTIGGTPFDVVNNAGSVVRSDGYGSDRGFGEREEGQFDEPTDLFAWCGGAVLLRPAYLERVGLFDERFFLYYEDTDLSWRGRAQGWTHRFVPGSVVHHLHAASSVEGSGAFHYYTERNRLLMLVKNAPKAMVHSAVRSYLGQTYDAARRDIAGALLQRRRPNTVPVRRRMRAFLGFLRMWPAMRFARRRIRRRQVVADSVLLAELESPPAPRS